MAQSRIWVTIVTVSTPKDRALVQHWPVSDLFYCDFQSHLSHWAPPVLALHPTQVPVLWSHPSACP